LVPGSTDKLQALSEGHEERWSGYCSGNCLC